MTEPESPRRSRALGLGPRRCARTRRVAASPQLAAGVRLSVGIGQACAVDVLNADRRGAEVGGVAIEDARPACDLLAECARDVDDLHQDGRLVLRSAARPDYGVEVSAAAGSERMQMRAVAFEAGGRGPDPARDRDAETIWCGDVSTLQERLGAIGGDLRIEKALPVGATPLKRVTITGAEKTAAAEVPALRERTFR